MRAIPGMLSRNVVLTAGAAGCALAAGCAPAVLTDTRWNEAAARPAGAACTVTVEDVGTRPWTGTRLYTAEGRLIWGQSRLEYDSRSEERVEHDAAGRVVTVVSRYEREFREGSCDVEGGCDQPARRSLARMRFTYDAGGRVVRAVTETTWYRRDRERWIEVATDRDTVELGYDAAGRLIERSGPSGAARFEYRGDTLVAAWFRATVSMRSRIERDASGRVSRIDRGQAVQAFEHDDAGRLTRVRWGQPGDDLDEDQTWRYDAAGRLAYQDRGHARLPGADRDGITYRYDALGRLTARLRGSTVLVTYGYEGACDRVVVEPAIAAPQALEVAFGRSCAVSPGYLVTVCAPPLR